jgi:hypothetical protein
MKSLVRVAALIALLTPLNASAYVLERAESGAAVHWAESCVTWWMEVSGCSSLTPEETRDVLRDSFEAWDEFEGMYIDFEEGGISCVASPGLDEDGPLNIAVWRQGTGSWPYAARVVGLTTLTFDKETGEIVDADMEFNEEDFVFSKDMLPNTYDLQHAVTHEVGHILGLGHSTVRGSIMHETAGPEGWEERALSTDDREGVSANHGLDMAPPSLMPCGVDAPQGTVNAPFCPEAEIAGCSSDGGLPVPLSIAMLASLMLLIGVRRRPQRFATLWLALLVTGLTSAPEPAGAATCQPYRVPGGEAIYWAVDSVTLAIDSALPEELDSEDMLSSVTLGLRAWSDLPCVTMEVEFRDDGEGFSDCPGEVLDDGLQCVYWVLPDEDWRFGMGLVAVTLVHHNAMTGEIVDTDLAINGTGNFTWSSPPICDIDSPDHDLLATLTHEFGHFFGLDHSSVPQSVMEAATGPGDCDKRTLEDIDRDCLCATLEETQPLVQTTIDASVAAPLDVADGEEEDTGTVVEARPPLGDGCAGSQTNGAVVLMLLILLWCAHPSRRRLRLRPRPSQAR